MTILVTGANGFVGCAVLKACVREGRAVLGVVRGPRGPHHCIQGPGLEPDADWSKVVAGARVIVHAAARVHVMNDRSIDPLSEFRRVNVQGTLALARQAAQAGVRRFVFISSIKVNGESTPEGRAFSAGDLPAPVDPYGISKAEAECALRELVAETGMELTIIRPPLVYGPGVKANFLAMMRWLSKGVPLPLGAIHNQRSLVGLGNLVDLILTCLDHPKAAGQTFLVSDGEDLSTSELLRRMSNALGTSARLLPVPPGVVRAAAVLLGRGEIARRLCDSLRVDISKTCALLGWSPPCSVDKGLRETASHFLELQSR